MDILLCYEHLRTKSERNLSVSEVIRSDEGSNPSGSTIMRGTINDSNVYGSNADRNLSFIYGLDRI